MKVVTSYTIFNDAVGIRMSVSFSEVDETTGRVINDNNRIDRVITDNQMKSVANSLKEYAQEFVDEE